MEKNGLALWALWALLLLSDETSVAAGEEALIVGVFQKPELSSVCAWMFLYTDWCYR